MREYVDRFEGAFIVFHYEQPEGRSWRLSYLEKRQNNAASTNAKRYTYLCGKDYPCRTIAERFYALQSQDLNAINLEKAFSVEALSDEFFTEYTAQYNNICKYIYENRTDTTRFGEAFADCEDKFIRDYVKKMMGRITFLHFLQKKGWLGVPKNAEWGQGDVNFMYHLFEYANDEQKEDFLDLVLEPIFFNCLNKPRENDLFDTNVTKIGEVRIPYLNGGLFEKDEIDKPQSTLPKEIFEKLLDFYARFNFTIDENDPLDAEVGIDPEMLGKIFENLLEDNKDKGAFYTPKEIVNYMCKESLIAYLVTEAQQACEVNKQRQENFEAAIRALVEDPEMTVSRIKRYDERQLEVLSRALMEVKICDPAIGSGAFPMGLLNLLFKCRTAVNNALGQNVPPAELKKDIIRNNIYGVDIEKGAIDIARLRFWLSIVVDLDEPEALPNFDYKFMQGNSLLEQFAGVDLSDMFATKATEGKGSGVQLISFDEVSTTQTILHERLRHYFGMRTGEDKHQLREKVNQAVADLICAKVNEAPELVSQIRDIDVSANDQFFLWHTWFAEVFNRPSKQGFDIVIGNPPYIKELGNESIFAPVNNSTFGQKYHAGKMDYWYYFMHQAIENVCDDGVISFITSRYWINSTGAKKVIKHISEETSFINIVDIGKLKVFDNVLGYHMVSILIKNINSNQCRYYAIKDDVRNLSKGVFTTERVIKRENLFKKNEIVLENRIEVHTTQVLNDVCNVSQGIVEASDKISSKMYKKKPLPNHYIGEGIFVLSIEEYESLNLSAEEKGIIELFEDNGCLSRYSIDYQKTRRLIYADSFNHEKIARDNHFVNIKNHLDNVSEYITSSYKPYGLHRARKYEDFTQPKLIGPSMFINPCYSYDNRNLFVGMSYNIITPKAGTNLFFILGVLNSQYCRDWLYSHAKHRGAGVDVGVDKLRTVPIPIATPAQQQPIIELVDTIIAKKQANPKVNTAEEEQQIDQQVYKLYGLT